MLGHSSIVLTADTHNSVLPEVAHKAAEKALTPAAKSADPNDADLALICRASHRWPQYVRNQSPHGFLPLNLRMKGQLNIKRRVASQAPRTVAHARLQAGEPVESTGKVLDQTWS